MLVEGVMIFHPCKPHRLTSISAVTVRGWHCNGSTNDSSGGDPGGGSARVIGCWWYRLHVGKKVGVNDLDATSLRYANLMS